MAWKHGRIPHQDTDRGQAGVPVSGTRLEWRRDGSRPNSPPPSRGRAREMAASRVISMSPRWVSLVRLVPIHAGHDGERLASLGQQDVLIWGVL